MRERLISILQAVAPALEPAAIDAVRSGDKLLETGLIDSLTIVSLMEALEQEFGLEFGPDDMEMANFETLESIRGLIEKRQSAK